MFLLLALGLIVQIVQIHGSATAPLRMICSRDATRNFDFGNDYIKWIRVSSLNECSRECVSASNGKIVAQHRDRDVCLGFTWVKDGNRNCALYNWDGIDSGVTRSGQDSYYCVFPLASNATPPKGPSGVTGISDVKTGGGIGDHTLKCPKHHCEATNGSGKCCLERRLKPSGPRRKWTTECPKSCGD